jgi:hypothetical protein
MPLVSAAQMNALRTVAYNGLDTPISILRSTQIENDYGSEEVWVTVEDTVGWIKETSVFRLDAPIDADIRSGDRVGIEGDMFSVNDVNTHNTIRVFCKATMRRVE